MRRMASSDTQLAMPMENRVDFLRTGASGKIPRCSRPTLAIAPNQALAARDSTPCGHLPGLHNTAVNTDKRRALLVLELTAQSGKQPVAAQRADAETP